MAEYADPDVLVSTEWVAEHHGDPTVRIVESNEDRALYTQGHVPGAVEIDWQVDLQNQVVRDYVDRKGFEEICRNNGCLLYTSPSPRDGLLSRMPSSA